MSLAKKINAAIAAHGCHMQQDEGLIDHIVEHADQVRAESGITVAINVRTQYATDVAALKAKIQELTKELAVEKAKAADMALVKASDEGEPEEADEFTDPHGEHDAEAPVDAAPKAVTSKLVKAPAKKKSAAKKPAKGKK